MTKYMLPHYFTSIAVMPQLAAQLDFTLLQLQNSCNSFFSVVISVKKKLQKNSVISIWMDNL